MKLDIELSLYSSKIKTKNIHGATHIWDVIRKKYVVLQPEEMVRQLLIHHFIATNIYSKELIQVEKAIYVNDILKRFDIVVYDKGIQPFLLIECKSFKTKISQATFDQIAMYNSKMNASFLMISNGIDNYCAEINYQEKSYTFISALPTFPS